MQFAADTIKSLAGALSDVLVAQNDSRLPGADCVLSSELMHSEPAMQVCPGALLKGLMI